MLKAVSETGMESEWEWAGVSDAVLMKHGLEGSLQPPAQLQAKVRWSGYEGEATFLCSKAIGGWKTSSSARLYLGLFSDI